MTASAPPSTGTSSSPKTILVTGASSGIGLAVARALVGLGHTVIGTSRNPAGLGSDVRIPGVRYIALDQTDSASIARCAQEAGDIDILVNNAGASQMGALEDTPMSAIADLFATNVFGPIELTKTFLPGMRERRYGVVVMVGSMLSSFPLPFRSTYSATKSAIKGFADASRRELAPFGVSVFTVEPGTIATGIGDRRQYFLADDSPYRADYATVAAATRRNEQRGLTAESISDLIVDAVFAPHPKPLYARGNNARAVFALRRVLPRDAMLGITARFHGLRRARS